MISKTEVKELLRRLLELEHSEAAPDSPANPIKTRKARTLAIRRRVVKALGRGSRLK